MMILGFVSGSVFLCGHGYVFPQRDLNIDYMYKEELRIGT